MSMWTAVRTLLRRSIACKHTSYSHQAYGLVEAEVVDLRMLSAAERNDFLDRLYLFNQYIFDGVSKDDFSRCIHPQGAARNRIQIYRNKRGAQVGYCAIHLFELQSGRRALAVLRAEAGLLAGYRGSGVTMWFGCKEALRYKALHPLRTVVLFAITVHPSSYHMLCKYLWRCYPYPGRRIPDKWHQLLLDLAQSCGDKAVDPADPLIRQTEWITRNNSADTAAWHESNAEDVRFFLSRNSGYPHGHGLAMIAPLSMSNFFVSAIQYLLHFVPQILRG